MYHPPDRPLIVKCTFDKWHKRITFSSARNCSYDLLRRKVEQCFSLYATSYLVSWKDDDGEITSITTDEDLLEAIQFFQAGDDAPMSSAASILSGRSFGARKITLRVTITVEYDGPSLSDTSSLASLEEFKGKNASQQSFSFGTPTIDLDDDSVTVSSRDPGTSSARSGRSGAPSRALPQIPKQKSFMGSDNPHTSVKGGDRPVNGQSGSSRIPSTLNRTESSLTQDIQLEAAEERYPLDPSAVFERLKLAEDDASSVNYDSLGASERGAAWLRDQNERVIRSMLGALPEPSVSDDFSFSLGGSQPEEEEDSLGGDLALQRDPSGKYYYTYTSGSSSQFQGSGADDDAQNGNEGDAYVRSVMRDNRPTSMQLNWLASQRVDTTKKLSRGERHPMSIAEELEATNGFPHTIDKELLPFLPIAGPSPDILTDCSNCGSILDAIRYVCSTCGPKTAVGESTSEKGKDRATESSPITMYTYPPVQPTHPLFSSPNSSSSQTYVGSSDYDTQRYKPLPSIPPASSVYTDRTRLNVPPTSPTAVSSPGYELCSACLESVGIYHAVESGLAAPGSSPVVSNMSPSHDDAQRASQWRRAAPKKGQLRHAFQEKVWGHLGWEDVVLDEAQVSECSTCNAVTEHKRYKCASCTKMHLCRACYSQVHELHPSHAFLIVPDKPLENLDGSDFPSIELPDSHEELSLTHPGVKCAHCLLDIVGARFHCAICDSIDICSNCESAGLPGNLDSADGGHNSSHILIKIPYPLETAELQNASRRALHLWRRDGPNVGQSFPGSKAESEISSYAHTMIGSGSRESSHNDHRLFCNGCGHLIVGVRYQCAHCPSLTSPYSLCSECEKRSYIIHDPMHIFFKLPRPVLRPIQSAFPMLPPLYKMPAGPPPNIPKTNDPRAYLASLVHPSAICDRCMTCIEGEWFRCAYCARDLCDNCEGVDTHDDTHVFLVLKAPVDMALFKNFANLDSQEGSPPVLAHPVYR
ncbi:ZZ-type zinc finger-containing protein P35G2.11c [Psilocybe cubensis]|uniref:ZZ-type zinc finger-containing protein P35G2.11c n=2 Tax=Psilocybe cubensis TaxID=181762 RepID=A0ACB8GVG1_PSICU|nr:ZZ-type zinc finger-containing protein P35G2.11c [Psilocybe cubensis]KAH9479475.1 ZZ-type zinc finger-containing protein P35G2.11c [Psilocybe cubensis]